ncbi:MAG: aminopeptidase P family protein [Rhodospirillaceae bacterium]|nr:aminopeptidase P family protein [Rhodospirillaceae bacterium]
MTAPTLETTLKTAPILDPGAVSTVLREAGPGLDEARLRRLLAGVAGAPVGNDPEAWMRLVSEHPTPDLAAALRRLHDAVATPVRARPGPAERLAALRAALVSRGLDGFLVPHSDEQQNEYIPPRAERLAWLTGFSGSAGMAIVLMARAAVFVDGRYTLQVRQQADIALFEPRHISDEPPMDWLADHLPQGGKLGYDPWLHTPDQLDTLRKAIAPRGGTLVPVEHNPVDEIWTDQPAAPIAPVVPHPEEFAGRASADKRAEIAAALAKGGATAAIVSDPAAIAWLLNIRGGDVARTPLPLSFAIVHQDARIELYVEPLKLIAATRQHLGNAVRIEPVEALGAALDKLGADGEKVLCDRASVSVWIVERLRKAGASVALERDLCALPRAIRNETERAGMRDAHRRDAASMVRFLAWFSGQTPGEALHEVAVAEKLASFRREDPLFRDLSFDTIAGAGPNGAIVHYHATTETSRHLQSGELFLLDSGAQYLNGTTDVTRTLAIGTPSAEMRDRFTRVLKGHIAIATVRFPQGTSGSQLDTLARAPLWQLGLDYDHGTGHGVGSYLGVHDGPQRISKVPNQVALRPGMVISNEPGYYKTGAYGIRIENLVEVVESPPAAGVVEERKMLGFETLTLVPLDRNLVEPSLLTVAEMAWLDAYHARVREAVTPFVDAETAAWLAEATRSLAR